MLSYFGCDQSQVQRYLTAKSVDEGRQSLMMSAYWKIPLQALVLLTGVLLFVFYTFNQPPMLFNPEHAEKIRESARAGEYQAARRGVQPRVRRAPARRPTRSPTPSRRRRVRRRGPSFTAADAAVKDVRLRAARLVNEVTGDAKYKAVTGDTPSADVNYVFPTFVTTRMPIGLVGLMIAAIFAAAMSSIAAELNSLATATVIDIYRRLLKPTASDAHYPATCRSWLTLALGPDRLRRRELRRRPRLAHRGRQPVRFVLLRLAARRVRARAGLQARHRHRRVHRSDRGNRRRARVRLPSRDQERLVPLAQSARRDRRRDRRHRRQPAGRGRKAA